MDVETVDQQYQMLEQESQQLGQTIQNLASKLQTAGDSGNAQAKEWMLDLKGIALQIQQEQMQVQSLLQALHGFAVNTIQQLPQQAQPQVQVQAVPQQQQQGGGLLSRFLGGNFGQAMTTGVGMGAGFGLADGLINSIFD